MLRSLMTAVTGVKAHQTMLDVTGNNIANVNTTGYKKDFTIFQDLLYQTNQGASGPGDNRGGINPSQVGLGVTVASIETIHSQGPSQYTGNKSDMMINGDGFFVLRSGASTLFSRAGAFIRDENNNLVQSGSGYRLQGYKMERDPLNPQNFVRASELSDINIPMGKKMEPRATTLVNYQCNLDSRSSSYLPIGFPDLPFNAECGTPGNKEGVAKVKMGDVEYEMKFNTKLDSADGKKYFTIEISNGGVTKELVFDMTGVRGGKPVLRFNGIAPAAPNQTDIDLPGGGASCTAVYDNDTGNLKIVDKSGGATLFQYNLQKDMNYNSFKVKDGTDTYEVLAEFNEQPTTKPSNMGTTPMDLTVWFGKPGANPGDPMTFTRVVYEVQMNAAGQFEFDNAKIKEGTLPGGLKAYDGSKTPPEGNFRLVPSGGDGKKTHTSSALTFQADKNMAAPTDKFDTVSQINQGGFHQTKKTIFDCQGNPHTLEVNFKKIAENRWRWEAFLLEGTLNEKTGLCEDSSGNTINKLSSIQPSPASGELVFCGCGPFCKVYPEGAELEFPFSLDGKANQKIKLNFDGHGDKMNGVTQFASETTTKAIYQDGYKMGVLKDFNIGADGTISGTFSNGQVQKLYRVALATFANQQGLEKTGETAFIPTINSGEPNIDAADSNGKGTITGATLEMSNVDLTEEFTRLIISQRGFQANTRVVTTSDQILEEVVNLKR